MQRRDQQLLVRAVQRLRRDVLREQELEPVEELRGRRLLLQPRHLAQVEEHLERLGQQLLLEAGEMHVDDPRHRLAVGKADVVEEAAAQERVGQLLLVVRRDHDERTVRRAHRPLRLVDVELHPVELAQQVVRKLDVGLVDLVDQHDRRRGRFERLPQHAALDVVRDVADVLVAQLRVAQPRHGVVLVEALLRLGRRLDVPLHERPAERPRDFLGEHRLAGAGLALDQQRALQRDRRVDREHQVRRGDVGVGAFEAHGEVRVTSGRTGMLADSACSPRLPSPRSFVLSRNPPPRRLPR